jgi:hypothetical protein
VATGGEGLPGAGAPGVDLAVGALGGAAPGVAAAPADGAPRALREYIASQQAKT